MARLAAAFCGAVAATATALAQGTPGDRDWAIAPGQSCVAECHQDLVTRRYIHGPALDWCERCHVQGDAKSHTFYLVRPKEELCQSCHALAHGAVEHAPVKEGRCLECHDPHGSRFPRVLRADPRRDLCTRCHKNSFSEAAFVHGPVATGACIVCHQPHASEHRALLAGDSKSLCLTCHSEVLSPESTGHHVHPAMEQGCVHCHDPHASEHRHQLKQSEPGLCLSCHQPWFDQTVAGAKVVHGAVMNEGSCTACHEPHSSPFAALERDSQPGLCLSCHDKEIKDDDGKALANMAELLAKNPDHHGPIREGACVACHKPHAADHFRLLSADYPPQFYAPFDLDSFRLCFGCHIPDLVLTESGVGLTEFRDGERNLHWLHVNQDKGRTCRACHEVHASKRPAHVRESVPFGTGGWLLEINFERTEEGGSCAPGCHKPRGYSRLSNTRIRQTGATP